MVSLQKRYLGAFLEIVLFLLILSITATAGYYYGRIGDLTQLENYRKQIKFLEDQLEFQRNASNSVVSPVPTPTLLTQGKTITVKTSPTPTASQEPWGVAKQVGDSTWTIRIQMDDRMATSQEILEALNEYRYRHQKERLAWDERLAAYAQSRARYFTETQKLDEHKGFTEYMKDIENVKKLGFWSLGENSSYGYRVYGVHLIEWVFAGDEPHNRNQLNDQWTHVGIGIDGNQIDLIFGGNKM